MQSSSICFSNGSRNFLVACVGGMCHHKYQEGEVRNIGVEFQTQIFCHTRSLLNRKGWKSSLWTISDLL